MRKTIMVWSFKLLDMIVKNKKRIIYHELMEKVEEYE